MAAARTDLLTRIRQICRPEPIQHVADLIASVINDDAIAMKSALDMRNQRTFAVKVDYPKIPGQTSADLGVVWRLRIARRGEANL